MGVGHRPAPQADRLFRGQVEKKAFAGIAKSSALCEVQGSALLVQAKIVARHGKRGPLRQGKQRRAAANTLKPHLRALLQPQRAAKLPRSIGRDVQLARPPHRQGRGIVHNGRAEAPHLIRHAKIQPRPTPQSNARHLRGEGHPHLGALPGAKDNRSPRRPLPGSGGRFRRRGRRREILPPDIRRRDIPAKQAHGHPPADHAGRHAHPQPQPGPTAHHRPSDRGSRPMARGGIRRQQRSEPFPPIRAQRILQKQTHGRALGIRHAGAQKKKGRAQGIKVSLRGRRAAA